MAKPLSILFVTSEVLPFVKIGSIADVSYSLPLAIRDTGHDVRVMLPKYGCVSERKNRIHEINRLRDIEIEAGKIKDIATVKSSSINNPRVKVQAYIATNQTFFDAKKGIYGHPQTGELYADNDERFIFFSRTVIETCLLLGWFPDVIHCNDWTSALIPAFAKELFPDEFANTKFVLTIHNFSQQGVFPAGSFAKTGLPKEAKKNITYKNKFNFLKAGIHYADYITTVSPTYADEILKDKKYSDGLNAVLKAREEDFEGIINGTDVWSWNPEKDKLIKKKYSKNFEDFKYFNKEALMDMSNLDFDENSPVIGMVARFGAQKGFDLLLEAADKLLKEDLKLVILCDGTSEYKAPLKKLAKKHAKKVSLTIGYDEILEHQIIAGSDIFLAPSMFEPSGINALYSLAYGTAPVVRETGALKDLVSNYDAKKKDGNGFVFKKFTAEDLMATMMKALKLFADRETWNEFAEGIMSADFSWSDSVEKYNEIYSKIVKR